MQRDKTILIAAVAVVAIVGAGAFAAFGTAGAQEDVQTTNDTETANDTEAVDTVDRTIHVTATGSADAEPDKGIARVEVTAEGESNQEVRDQIATDSQALTEALDELGVEYETSQYSVDEHYDRHEPDEPEVTGVHSFRVTFDDPDKAGSVADAAAAAGANVRNVRLTLSEETRAELRDEAIQNAMEDARHQADTIAETGGLAVASPQNVDASQRSYRPVAYEEAATDAAGDAAAEPPTEVESGDVAVSYSVDVTYGALDE